MAKNGNSAYIQMQKIASNTQLKLQKMVNDANQLQADYNREEAQASRDWQEKMSRSAHQMEVEDLKKAGLNPVLSAGGSGAQSYTTSSASISPESGAAALAGLQESRIGALGNMESSRMQAAATRKAAAISAAAMRSAAAQSAAAQMYAAAMDYKGRKYASDMSYKTQKYKSDTDKWISQYKQASSWSGVFDKWFTKLTGSSAKDGFKQFNKKFQQGFDKFVNNYKKYFSNTGAITGDNFKLTPAGQKYVNDLLRKNGYSPTAANRKRFIQAYVFKSNTAYNSILSSYVSNHFKKSAKTPPVQTVSPGQKRNWRRNLR